ncbi:MAG TPA: hypothetical protein VL442_17040 [Mucilaginibacter sp.]|nr:hypothetical protein [Mucilaginibacter sp.]
MKTNKKYLIISIIVFCMVKIDVKAQKRVAVDSITAHWSRTMSVSREKALQMYLILSYRSTELKALLSNTNISGEQKETLLKEIMEDRGHKIDSAFTLSEKEKIYQLMRGDERNSNNLRKYWRSRHDSLTKHPSFKPAYIDSINRKYLNRH